MKSRLASISAPSPPRERTTLSESEQEQSKRALNVALASAAAAEAAVAAAHAAAEVVLLTGVPHSTTHQCDTETEQVSSMKIQADTLHSTHLCVRAIQEIAALKIQAAFRGYLVSCSSSFLYFTFYLLAKIPMNARILENRAVKEYCIYGHLLHFS